MKMEYRPGLRQSETVAALEIRLFGGFAVVVHGVPLPTLRTRKGQWLLALLALRHDRDTPRDWLAGTLWPDSDETLALANLRRSLNDLRHALGSESHRLLAPTPRSLRLDLTDAFCDVHAFDTAIEKGMRDEARGMSKAGNREQGIGSREQPSDSSLIPHPSCLREAVALYRGPLLEDCPEPWAVSERESREQAFLSAIQMLAHHAAQQGDHEEAILYLRRALTVNPLLENARTALMESLAATGESAEALRTYREFRLLLRRELNTEPDPQVAALYHRLRGEALGVGRWGAGDARPNIPNTRTPEYLNPQHLTPNAQRPTPTLFGRSQEITDIIAHLDSARLLTLTGIGGIGKTRLALAVAQEAAEDYPGGAWFVPLADLTGPERVTELVRDALGLPATPNTDPLLPVIVRLSDCPTLFILDNFEQLLPSGALVVQTMLERLPYARILVTSRQRLQLSQEWEYSVPPLPLPTAETPPRTPDDCLKYAGVELFVERARMRNPRFQLTSDNLAAVMGLCRTLEGIPLATELAAAWIQMLTPEQIKSRLTRRFDLLTTRQQDVPLRHRSLYAALESSYRLLPLEQQRFFGCLSVFRGGWTLDAAESVCAEPDALSILAALRDASLLLVEESGTEMRYRFLETVRDFAAEQTEAELSEAEQRHTHYFLHLAEAAAPQIGGAEQSAWLNRLEREHDNFRIALERCTNARGKQAALGLRLATLLHEFWDRRGYLSEGRSHLSRALEAGGEKVEPGIRAAALRAVGGLSHRIGDYVQAEACFMEALRLAREQQDAEGEAIALGSLGEVKGNSGDLDGGRELLEQALQKYRARGDRQREAEVLGFLGYLARSQDDFPTARALTESALEIQRSLGNRHGISWNLGSLAFVAHGEKNEVEANRLLHQALELNRELENRSGQAWALTSLASLAKNQGRYEEACSYLKQAIAHYRAQNEIGGVGWALFELGATQFKQEKWTEADETLHEALYLLELGGDRKLAGNVKELLEKLKEFV